MTRLSKKLSHCRLGPYLVKRHVRKYAYHLILPQPKRCLHPVFNVIKLTLTSDDPLLKDIGTCHLLQNLLTEKRSILWKKQDVSMEPPVNTWEYLENLNNAQEKVTEFYTRNPRAPHHICILAFGSIPFRPISVTSTSDQCFSGGG